MKTKIYSTRQLTILILMVFLFPFNGFTQQTNTFKSNTQEFIPGTIVIKVKEGIGPFEKQDRSIAFGIPSLDEKVQQFAISKLEKRFKHKPIPKNSGLPDLSRIYRIEFPKTYDVHQVAKVFANDPNIEYAEPMPIGKFTELPDDPMYANQQHLPQIMASEAWDVHKGEDGEEVVIAIVDTGADWLHPDLTENCWQNLGEDADGDGVTLEFNNGVWERDPDDLNGIDDDNNGYVDDVIGWDFHEEVSIGNGSNPDPLWNQGPYEHGTHCAGIAAGRTNNGIGISSVSWNVKYMPIQTDDGNNTVLYGIDGVVYAAENGADIISNSWYLGYAYSQYENDAMQYAIGLGSIICFAAANDNSSNIALPGGYPGVISVAAVNPDDTRASFSNYGIAVDIAAPGVSILSTITNNNYASWDGTSMATPMVAGLFALLKSYQPTWTNDQLIEQVIGTADNIDALNPGYEKALGSGRINAFHTLVDENVEVSQELRLEFLNFNFEDENGNGVIEAGETVFASISMRNFAHLVSDDNATFSLTSFDPDIEIINGTGTGVIPADSEFELENIFEFRVAEGAEAHIADLLIEVSSDLPIIYGDETELQLLIAPSGFLVWEGDPNLPDYSGSFIKEFLEERGYFVLYTNTFPQSFSGFDAVFLSFGNWGTGNTIMSSFMANTLIEYLTDGGNIYLEGGDVLGFDQSNNSELLDLFGLASATDGAAGETPIEMLIGQTDAITHDMIFLGSNQASNIWIDKYQPSDNGVTAFIEDNYGIVAVQNDVPDAHRTFCFSYALEELINEDPHSSRYNILIEIMKFFGFPPSNGSVVANFLADQTEGEPSLDVQFTDWSIPDEGYEITSWAWDFNEDGEFDSFEQNPLWTYNEGGVFDVKLVVSTDADTDTLVKKDFITVRSGILVYEGQENTNGYSGTFIHDYLESHWYDNVGYTNNLPASLKGYDAVFLSFGNTGSISTELTVNISAAILQYCLQGGKIYIEGGDAMKSFIYKMFFGLLDVADGEKNAIDGLIGEEEAITGGMQFNSTNQLSYRSIDIYTILEDNSDAKVAFQESDYGSVAVEFNGISQTGQKTFCMSYALANLEDGDGLNTRDELLSRILDFFDVTVGVEETEIVVNRNFHVFPNPAREHVSLRLNLKEGSNLKFELFDLSGRLVSTMNNTLPIGTHQIDFEIADLPSGIYYFRCQSNTFSETIKWVKVE